MKRLAIMLIIALSATACAGTGNGEIESTETEDTVMKMEETTVTEDTSPKLLFEDNFDGTTLDTTKWETVDGWERQGASYWYSDAVSLDGDGHLVITVTPSEVENYVDAGCARTRGRFERAFGYYEASIKFINMQGVWCAFWLMGDTVGNVDGSGRDGTEIDIIESIHNENGVCNHALHWDGYGDAHTTTSKTIEDCGLYDGKFHTVALEWNEDEYVFYIDGNETWRTTDGGVCQAPLYMKLSVESAPWAGEVDHSALPAEMLVDYVRVWDKKPE